MKYLNSLTMFVTCPTTQVPDVRLSSPCMQVWSTQFLQILAGLVLVPLARATGGYITIGQWMMQVTHLFICSVLCLEEGWKKRWWA